MSFNIYCILYLNLIVYSRFGCWLQNDWQSWELGFLVLFVGRATNLVNM